MSTDIRARDGGHDQQPAPTRAQQKARALGLTSATGLVVGSIVGTGVFAMPAVLAGAGTSSLLVLGVIALGAMLLAMLFGRVRLRGMVGIGTDGRPAMVNPAYDLLG